MSIYIQCIIVWFILILSTGFHYFLKQWGTKLDNLEYMSSFTTDIRNNMYKRYWFLSNVSKKTINISLILFFIILFEVNVFIALLAIISFLSWTYCTGIYYARKFVATASTLFPNNK